jgi:23S rRNA (uracil1939-C5)-methyltransferase
VTAAGSSLTVTIEKIVHGGRGMGRWEGAPVFMPDVLEGERVEAVVTGVRKGYLEATPVRIVTASADRVDAPCPVFAACGGCQLQHLTYPAQLEAKRAIVAESLRRLGHLSIDVPPLTPSPDVFGYRLRAELKIGVVNGRRALGFYAFRSRELVPVSSCLVLHPRLQAALAPLADLVARSGRALAGLREIEVQTTGSDAAIVVVFRMTALDRRALGAIGRELRDTLPLRGLVASDHRRHRWVGGSDTLEERSPGVACRVSDRTFLQVNAGVNATLVAAVVEWAELTGRERVVDLYAGFGNFALPLARRADRVTAVESDPSAVTDARHNARALGQANLHIVRSAVEAWIPGDEDRRPDVAIIDPPRAGLSRAAMERLVALAPRRLLYVSCEPTTLARDAGRLAEAGYRLDGLRGFDMFPHTSHVELLGRFVHRA